MVSQWNSRDVHLLGMLKYTSVDVKVETTGVFGGAINGGTPKRDGFIMDNTMKMYDLVVPLFHETSI